MKISKSKLKELVKLSIREAEEWWDKLEPDEKAAYIKAHPKSQKAMDAKAKSKKKSSSVGDFFGSKADKNKEKIAKAKKKDDDSFDVGGPSYANVPKGAKTSKQAKDMKAAREKNIEKTDDVARSMGYKHTAEIVRDGSSDEIMDFMDAIEDKGQDFDKADELLNYIRDNEQGMRDDDDDMLMDFRQGIFKALTTPGVTGKGSGKSGKDIEKQAMSAADAANAKMDADEKEKEMGKNLGQMDGDDEDSMDDLFKQIDQDPPSNASDDYKLYQQGAQKIKNDILRIKAGNQDWSDIANSKEAAIEYLKGELEDYIQGMESSKNESIKESKQR